MEETDQFARVHKDTLDELFKAVTLAAHARRLATALDCLLLDRTNFLMHAHETLTAYRETVDRLYPKDAEGESK